MRGWGYRISIGIGGDGPDGVGPLMIYTEHLERVAPFYRDILGLPVKSYKPGHSMSLATQPVELVLHAP